MTEQRVVFDFTITFANGGGLQGQDFRLDMEGAEISDRELAAYIVEDLHLLMVSNVEIVNKRYIEESHKRSRPTSSPKIADLSHQIHSGMITYPGLPAPSIGTHLSRAASRNHYSEGTEFHVGTVEMVANTGTYIDTPFLRYPHGVDISSIPLQRITAVPGVVVDAQQRIIGPQAFADTETWGKAVLIRTGWDAHFGQNDYVGDHPHLTQAAAQRLADGGAALVGIDSSNIDDTKDLNRPAHSILLAHQIPIVEHLTRLDQLPATPFRFYAIPPPIVGIGTFPIRAVAQWD